MADSIRYGTTEDKEAKDRYFANVAQLPTASEFGPGIAVIKEGSRLMISDGESWTTIGAFTPSIYSAPKSATTTVAGQSEAIATGATKLRAINTDATNSVYIGFGMSAILAEAACSSGTAGVDRFLIRASGIADEPFGAYSHYAWLGDGGTVTVRITQGV